VGAATEQTSVVTTARGQGHAGRFISAFNDIETQFRRDLRRDQLGPTGRPLRMITSSDLPALSAKPGIGITGPGTGI
jgi:hypothetical protein